MEGGIESEGPRARGEGYNFVCYWFFFFGLLVGLSW